MYYTITNRIQWKIVWQAAICPEVQDTVSGARALDDSHFGSGTGRLCIKFCYRSGTGIERNSSKSLVRWLP